VAGHKAEYEMERRKLGEDVWANIMTLIGVDPAQPASATFTSFANIPDAFNEQESITTYVNIVALAMGLDAREFWPVSSGALGTASESLVMAQKAKGKGIGDLISTIERAVNWRLLPKRVEFHFDFQDDDEDEQTARIEEQKTATIMKMIGPDPTMPVATNEEIRQMLADNVKYFPTEFLDVDITDETTASDVDRDAEKAWGPLVTMDRHGNARSKQAARATPRGAPLEPWEGEVEFSEEEVEEALAEWDARVPEAAGLLRAAGG